MQSGLLNPALNVAGQTPLDLATGYVMGTEEPAFTVTPLRGVSLTEVFLEAAMGHMAPGRPYVVGFSGGRDSAVDLAIATRAARLNGLPDPIPATLRFPDAGPNGEEANQELVIRHLGLDHWERIDIHDELEVVGPVATRTLRALGPLWPANVHTLLPLMEVGRGGAFSFFTTSLDFYAFWRWAPLGAVLRGHRRPKRADLALLGAAFLPARARVAAAAKQGLPAPMPWLRPEVEQRALRLLRERSAVAPLRFDRAARTHLTHRCGPAARKSFEALAGLAGTELVQVVAEPRPVAALIGTGGWRGFGTRARAAATVAGDLLPTEALGRFRPPNYQRVLFGEHTRGFAERWSGGGLDDSLVDPERLRSIWLQDDPDWRTAGLMQVAWLHDEQTRTPRRPSARAAA